MLDTPCTSRYNISISTIHGIVQVSGNTTTKRETYHGDTPDLIHIKYMAYYINIYIYISTIGNWKENENNNTKKGWSKRLKQ